MALYSSANTIWTGDAYADAAKVKRIIQPHVCVYGTSVPENLYSGLAPENLTDGLVGRLLVFQSSGTPSRRKPQKRKIPDSVIFKLKSWAEFKPPGTGNIGLGDPLRIEKTHDADDRHEAYCDVVNEKHKTESEINAAVWSRAPEKAAKLALIFACCSTNETPRITLDAENWGIKLANYSTRLVLQAAQNSVAGSKYESDLKRVWMAIGNGCTQNDLTRKTQWLKQRERAEILSDLQVRGAIQTTIEATEKRPRTWISKRRVTL
jgi:hypothetical protein